MGVLKSVRLKWTRKLCSLAFCARSLELQVRHLIALDHRLYHQADEPKELNFSTQLKTLIKVPLKKTKTSFLTASSRHKGTRHPPITRGFPQ